MTKALKTKFVFFGTPHYAVFVLEELEKNGMLPVVVVCAPDRRAGRGMHLTAPPVKIWAEAHHIPVLQPEKLDEQFIDELEKNATAPQLFIVAAYGKIIPQNVLDMPTQGALNVHPSLLPTYRGPSPLEAPILAGDEESGVSIILLDEKMDHGPIVAQEKLQIGNLNKEELGEKLFRRGGQILRAIINASDNDSAIFRPHEQEHEKATYTQKITKEDGCIDLNDDPQLNWRKYRAYSGWPGTFFFTESGVRVKITAAEFRNGEFIIKKVIPEGKKETVYTNRPIPKR